MFQSRTPQLAPIVKSAIATKTLESCGDEDGAHAVESLSG